RGGCRGGAIRPSRNPHGFVLRHPTYQPGDRRRWERRLPPPRRKSDRAPRGVRRGGDAPSARGPPIGLIRANLPRRLDFVVGRVSLDEPTGGLAHLERLRRAARAPFLSAGTTGGGGPVRSCT